MYEESLSKAGLTPDQAKVYEALLKKGVLPAGRISKESGLKRGLTYKILGELEASGMVHKQQADNGVLSFEASHPLRLRELAEAREREAKIAQSALEGVMGNLISDFNLISGKPGVLVYEGADAINKITSDSLETKDIIRSYVDNEAVNRYLPKVNEAYVRERDQKGIHKKMITIDTPYIWERAKSFNPELTEVRVVPGTHPFTTVMQIYDDKVSYLTLEKDKMIGIIIQDARVAGMHRTLFEHEWEKAKPVPVGPEKKSA